MRTFHKNALLLIAACAISTGASAHTGHGTESFMEGLAHPFGLDHLLAMLTVGVWSVAALPARQAWQGPATFLLALVAGGLGAGLRTGIYWFQEALGFAMGMFVP